MFAPLAEGRRLCVALLQGNAEVVVPKEQLQLTETELDEEITKMLTANNPGAPTNLARYNHKVRDADAGMLHLSTRLSACVSHCSTVIHFLLPYPSMRGPYRLSNR
jgi:hypothetical protein